MEEVPGKKPRKRNHRQMEYCYEPELEGVASWQPSILSILSILSLLPNYGMQLRVMHPGGITICLLAVCMWLVSKMPAAAIMYASDTVRAATEW